MTATCASPCSTPTASAHALVFPSQRILGGWIKSATQERVAVAPMRRRQWVESP